LLTWRSALQKASPDQFSNDPARGLRRIIAVTANNDIRLLWWLIDGLDSWYLTGLPFARLSVDALWIALDAHLQWTLDKDFQESWNRLPRSIPVGAAIRGGIEDNGYAVFGQDPTDKSERAIEVLAILFIVAGLVRKYFSQRIGFENCHLNAKLANLPSQGTG
jgi:hypothetical protein